MVTETTDFWNKKRLSELDASEWESLCDGCGRCCLNKLEDIDSGLVFYTNVACRLLDESTCRCRDYPQRRSLVEGCLDLRHASGETFAWLPSSCAYRRLSEGKPLLWWHPLLSGSSETVHQAGISVRQRVINEQLVHPDQLEDHVITWIDY